MEIGIFQPEHNGIKLEENRQLDLQQAVEICDKIKHIFCPVVKDDVFGTATLSYEDFLERLDTNCARVWSRVDSNFDPLTFSYGELQCLWLSVLYDSDTLEASGFSLQSLAEVEGSVPLIKMLIAFILTLALVQECCCPEDFSEIIRLFSDAANQSNTAGYMPILWRLVRNLINFVTSANALNNSAFSLLWSGTEIDAFLYICFATRSDIRIPDNLLKLSPETRSFIEKSGVELSCIKPSCSARFQLELTYALLCNCEKQLAPLFELEQYGFWTLFSAGSSIYLEDGYRERLQCYLGSLLRSYCHDLHAHLSFCDWMSLVNQFPRFLTEEFLSVLSWEDACLLCFDYFKYLFSLLILASLNGTLEIDSARSISERPQFMQVCEQLSEKGWSSFGRVIQIILMLVKQACSERYVVVNLTQDSSFKYSLGVVGVEADAEIKTVISGLFCVNLFIARNLTSALISFYANASRFVPAQPRLSQIKVFLNEHLDQNMAMNFSEVARLEPANVGVYDCDMNACIASLCFSLDSLTRFLALYKTDFTMQTEAPLPFEIVELATDCLRFFLRYAFVSSPLLAFYNVCLPLVASKLDMSSLRNADLDSHIRALTGEDDVYAAYTRFVELAADCIKEFGDSSGCQNSRKLELTDVISFSNFWSLELEFSIPLVQKLENLSVSFLIKLAQFRVPELQPKAVTVLHDFNALALAIHASSSVFLQCQANTSEAQFSMKVLYPIGPIYLVSRQCVQILDRVDGCREVYEAIDLWTEFFQYILEPAIYELAQISVPVMWEPFDSFATIIEYYLYYLLLLRSVLELFRGFSQLGISPKSYAHPHQSLCTPQFWIRLIVFLQLCIALAAVPNLSTFRLVPQDIKAFANFKERFSGIIELAICVFDCVKNIVVSLKEVSNNNGITVLRSGDLAIFKMKLEQLLTVNVPDDCADPIGFVMSDFTKPSSEPAVGALANADSTNGTEPQAMDVTKPTMPSMSFLSDYDSPYGPSDVLTVVFGEENFCNDSAESLENYDEVRFVQPDKRLFGKDLRSKPNSYAKAISRMLQHLFNDLSLHNYFAPESFDDSSFRSLPKIPATFESLEQYREIMAQATLAELQNSIWSDLRGEDLSVCQCEVTGVRIAANLYEVDFKHAKSNQSSDPEDIKQYPFDIVALFQSPHPHLKKSSLKYSEFQELESQHHVIALVKANTKSYKSAYGFSVICHRKIEFLGYLGNRIRDVRMANGDSWTVVRLASILSTYRELESLFGAVNASFSADFLLNPGKNRVREQRLPWPLMVARADALRKLDLNNLNDSQLKVLKHVSSCRSGLFTIQGPPGTGKTTTIIAMIRLLIETFQSASQDVRILLCAPSNAATNEITSRFLAAWKKSFGDKRCPMVRIGTDRVEPPENIADYYTKHISEYAKKLVDKEELESLNNIEALQKITKAYHNRDPRYYGDPKFSIAEHQKTLKELIAKTKKRSKNAVASIISEIKLVCTTLNASARTQLTLFGNFTHLIIDEAAQAVELCTLIPMRHRIQHITLFGDPRQLPATVLSVAAARSGLSRSLFERLEMNGLKPAVINVQYRMHPTISSFPNATFYENKLIDHSSILQRPLCTVFRQFNGLSRVTFFNCHGDTVFSNKSYSNIYEACCLIGLIKLIVAKVKTLHKGRELSASDFLIITPYSEQRSLIIKYLRDIKSPKYMDLSSIQVSSVDACQGGEANFVLFSAVRSLGHVQSSAASSDEFDMTGGMTIGFVSDSRRFNVAITRAREAFICFGNEAALSSCELWKSFIDLCRSNSPSKEFAFHDLDCSAQELTMAKLEKLLHTQSSQ